jgi:hypothetical protein
LVEFARVGLFVQCVALCVQGMPPIWAYEQCLQCIADIFQSCQRRPVRGKQAEADCSVRWVNVRVKHF